VKDVDVVTYVPTVNARVRQRGFDHAKVVAAFVAQHINRPHETLLLRKGNNRQVGATRQTRRAQVAGTLTVVNVTKPKGKRILIVDDVISTGATLEEAAKTLKAAGAKRVYVTVLATNR
jgi:predicted amidophosphoribosyltransferase